LNGGAEARVEGLDAVPGFVECGAFNGHGGLREGARDGNRRKNRMVSHREQAMEGGCKIWIRNLGNPA
jgi:hypothetical protein